MEVGGGRGENASIMINGDGWEHNIKIDAAAAPMLPTMNTLERRRRRPIIYFLRVWDTYDVS